MGEGKTNMFGKTYNTIGSTDSNFIIKTKGDLKVQWGGKFIDVIKNGKLASAGADILKVASSSDDISSNGVYLVPTDEGNEVWVSIDGTKVNIAGEVGTTYVSFLTEQKEVTADQKYTALVNAGLYYETLEDAQEAGVKAGLIFIVGENKLYIAKDGQLSEYPIQNQQSNISEQVFEELTIGELRIYKGGDSMNFSGPYMQFLVNEIPVLKLENEIRVYRNISINDSYYIQSSGATENSGFRLYENKGKSVLEVDSVIWRNMDSELNVGTLSMSTSTIYSKYSNKIIRSEYEDKLICKLQYYNQFKKDQRVYIFIQYGTYIQVQYGNGILEAYTKDLVDQDIQIEVDYSTGDSLGTLILTIPAGQKSASMNISYDDFQLEDYTVISGPDNISTEEIDSKNTPIQAKITEISGQNITLEIESFDYNVFTNLAKGAVICSADCPLIRIEQGNLDVLDLSKTRVNEDGTQVQDNTIHTRIGQIAEENFKSLKECPEEQEEVQVGIYSDNFIGLNSKLYDSVFKKRCDYPKYDESVEIPEDFQDEKYNKAVPNIEWIKELIKLAVPSGTIAMYNGQSEIPEGWAVCDGNNGTPNLVGKFIKAVSAIDQIGDNESELNENNEFIITQEHLPKHSHPHKPHTHNLGGDLSGTTGSSGDLTVSLNYSNYNWGIESVQKTFVTSVTGEGVTSETGTVDGVSNIRTQGGNATGGSHTHSISLDAEGGVSLSSATSEEETLEDSEWLNKPIKIEPRSYSLVFIMKL